MDDIYSNKKPINKSYENEPPREDIYPENIQKAYTTWVEIDLAALAYNTREIRRLVGEDIQIIGAVKANAYGHGALPCAETMLNNGVDYLAVSNIYEARELRLGGIKAPIIILSEPLPCHMEEAVKEDIILTIFSLKRAEALSAAGQRLDKVAKIHLKIDTGMGRIGFYPGAGAIDEIIKISQMPALEIQGIFSHFANSDDKDKTFALRQIKLFEDFIKELEARGLNFPLKHMANSGAVVELPQSYFNMVRPGIILYGCYPAENTDRKKLDLKPVMSLKGLITNIKTVPKNTSIGYSRKWVSSKESLIATVQLGYGDGFLRALSPGAYGLVEGIRVPVIGNICMDQLMLDISCVPQAKIGSCAVFIGRQGGEEIHLDELAKTAKTINYELACFLGLRLPKIFKKQV